MSLVWKDKASAIKAGVALDILILKSEKLERAELTYSIFKTILQESSSQTKVKQGKPQGP